MTIAIGSGENSGVNGSYSGHVRVYAYNSDSTKWFQQGLDIDGETGYDRSGTSVSLSNDGLSVVVGAKGNDGNSGNPGDGRGHVRVYQIANRTDVVTACISYTWINGNTYYANDSTSMHTIFNSGQDTVVILNLSVTTIDTTVTNSSPTLTANATSATSYQWLDCDNNMSAIAGAINSTYTATANGNYAVSITINGCTDTSACINLSGVVGIDENSLASKINIYPNPTNGIFTIELEDYEKTQVSVTTITGKEVYPTINVNASKVDISLINFDKGVYFVKVQYENHLFIKKIIKH